MAEVYSRVFKAGRVQGLFLSTGIVRGGANTQNCLLDTAEILRNRLGYTGYLHLKLMPGIEKGQIRRAMQLADRISLNLEAPTAERLAFLAPQKHFMDEIMTPLGWIREIKNRLSQQHAWGGRWPSVTTQFVVGPAGETDIELLRAVVHLNQTVELRRAYFEAFGPVPGTPLENHPPEPPLREHRLYQASFLLREYGYDLEELPFDPSGKLPIEEDPKIVYARRVFREDPVEINRACREELLRIPGIGPRSLQTLLAQRKVRTISELGHLRKMGVLVERAAPYITLAGKRPPIQLSLFPL
jgi:predicted DNA-binding helix-hairpin-helix protein